MEIKLRKRLIYAGDLWTDIMMLPHNGDMISSEEAERAIMEAPSVDAVEVVRCKDCKHYRWEQEPCHGRTQRFCRLHKGLVVVDRETFCSYGERKDSRKL